MPQAHSKISIAVAHLASLFALGYPYYYFVATLFQYQRFIQDFSIVRLIFSVAILLALSTMISNRKPVSFHLNHLAILTILTPSLILFYAGGAPLYFIIITCAGFITMIAASRIDILNIPRISNTSPRAMMTIMTVLSALIVLYLALVIGLGSLNFDLRAVYELREEIRDTTGELYTYIQAFGSKAILPLAIALACAFRQRSIVIALFALSILMFGYTTHKSMALYPFVVIAMYYATGGVNRLALLVWGVVALAALAVIDMLLYLSGYPSTELWLLSFLIRRALFVPAQLNADYLAIFSVSDWYYWSNSRITLGFISEPSMYGPPAYVAIALGGVEYSANTGWIGSGYSQLGAAGVLVYSAALGFIFAFFDGCARRIDIRVVLAASVIPVFAALTVSDLVTVLSTHGLGLTCVLLMLIAPSKEGLRA